MEFIDFIIEGVSRKSVGTPDSRRLRLRNIIPAVMYSYGVSVSISIDLKKALNMLKLMSSEVFFIKLKIDDTINDVIIKEVVKHPYKNTILHIDFQKVKASDYLNIRVPILFVGDKESSGIKSGGVLMKYLKNVKIKCKASDLPSSLTADISNLALNDIIYLSDIKLPEGVKLKLFDKSSKQKYAVASIIVSKVAQSKESDSKS